MVLLYTLVNLTYLRALPLATLGASPRIGESAAVALLGPTGGRLMALAVILVLFGNLSSGILTAARIYLPMAWSVRNGSYPIRTALSWYATLHAPVVVIDNDLEWTMMQSHPPTFE